MPKNSMTRNSTARNSTLAPNVVEPTRHADVYGHGTCPVSQTGQDMGDEFDDDANQIGLSTVSEQGDIDVVSRMS